MASSYHYSPYASFPDPCFYLAPGMFIFEKWMNNVCWASPQIRSSHFLSWWQHKLLQNLSSSVASTPRDFLFLPRFTHLGAVGLWSERNWFHMYWLSNSSKLVGHSLLGQPLVLQVLLCQVYKEQSKKSKSWLLGWDPNLPPWCEKRHQEWWRWAEKTKTSSTFYYFSIQNSLPKFS